MATRTFRLAGAALALGLTVSALSACGDNDDTSGDGASASSGGGAKKIALLLPENKTARYEAFDKPMFEAAVKAGCPDCQVLYSNANQDAAKQQQQAEAAHHPGRRRHRPERGRRQGRRRRSSRTPRARASRSSPTTASSPAPTTTSRSTTRRSASSRAPALVDAHEEGRQDLGRHRHDQRLADRRQRGRLQGRRPQRPRRQRLQDRGRVRHPRLEPGQGPGVDGEPDRLGQGATSSASTPPTTAPAAARSRPSRVAASTRSRR